MVIVDHETRDRARAVRHRARAVVCCARAAVRRPRATVRRARADRRHARARTHRFRGACVFVGVCFGVRRLRRRLRARERAPTLPLIVMKSRACACSCTHVRRACARLAPAVVPIEAFQVHGQLSKPCMCMRTPRFSERSPRRSLNCTTASDAGSGRYASTVCCLARERARRLRSPRSCCGARPGATTRDRAAGRVRSGGVRSARPNTVRTDAGSRTGNRSRSTAFGGRKALV